MFTSFRHNCSFPSPYALKAYQEDFIKEVKRGVTVLGKGESYKIDGHSMTCPVKFMEHIIKTRTHEFVPHHEIQQIQSKVMEHQKHLEMSKDMGGYSM